MRTTHIDLPALDALEGEALALFVWSDMRPLGGVAGYIDWRLCGALSQAVQNFVSGDPDEVLLLPAMGRFGPRRLFIFGLGTYVNTDLQSMRTVCRLAYDVMSKAGVQQFVFAAPNVRITGSSIEDQFVKALQMELGERVSQVLVQKQL